MPKQQKKSDPDDTRLKRYYRWAADHPVISVAIVAVVALVPVLALINGVFDAAENVEGLTEVSPRPPLPQAPLAPVETANLAPPNQTIELAAGGDVPILRREGQDIVVFNYEGMTTSRKIYPDRVTLVASFRVKIEGYSLAEELLADHISVASDYDRSLIADLTGSALKLVDGDVVTVLGHQFKVEHVWHDEDMGRPRGDLSVSVLLVAIR